jgi:hypothetical protein
MNDGKLVPPSEVYSVTESDDAVGLCTLCKKSSKFGMYISLGHKPGKFPESIEEYYLAAPYLRYPENETVLINGFGFLLFDNRDDMEHAFDTTVGDNGPTKYNDYDGPASVYALTCGPDGVELDENT